MTTITACTHDCPDACSLLAESGPKGLRLRGNPDHPITQGFVCPKLQVLRRRLTSPDRLRAPRLRHHGRWVDISWDEALGLCAENITRYRDTPQSILHMRGSGNRGAVKALSVLFFQSLGASGLHGSLCDETGIAACVEDFGSLRHNDIRDLLHTSAIINWGRDFGRSSMHTAAIVREARGKDIPVITIAPGQDTAHGYTDHFIRINPGTDRFLALATLQEVLRRKGGLPPRMAERCAHSDDFMALLHAHGLELLDWCGVGESDVRLLADWYTGPGPVATVMGWGLQRYAFGGQNVRFINALAMLSGQIGRMGGGSYYNLSSMAHLHQPWKHSTNYSRTLLMPALAQELRTATPPVRMAWIECINPANQFPRAADVAQALDNLDFVVVVDAFMTDTAEIADLVLPPALMLEQEDILGSFLHEYVQLSRKVLDPPPGVRTDRDILDGVGRLLDPPLRLPEVETVLRQCVQSPTLKTNLETLRSKGFVRSTRPAQAYADLRFDHPDERYHLPTELAAPAPPDPDFPLYLLTLVNRNYIHSQIPAEDQTQAPIMSVHPDTLSSFGLTEGPGRVETALGALSVTLQADAHIHPHCAVYRRGPWGKYGGGINRIIAARETDMGGGTAFYEQRCRLAPAAL